MSNIYNQCLNPILCYMKYNHSTHKNELSGFLNLKKFVDNNGNEFTLELFKNQKYFSIIEMLMEKVKGDVILLPCRKCVNCQLKRSKEWAIRNTLESREYEPDESLFITLTYDDEKIRPLQKHIIDKEGRVFEWYSLWRPDLQAFIKKLRDVFDDKKIRFYAVGEYGGRTYRPHYHILLYGLSLADIESKVYKNKNYALVKKYDTKDGSFYYSELLENEIWSKGFVDISNFTCFTAGYVSRYCTKKITDDKTKNGFIFYNGLQKEFNAMSLKPAIGKNYVIKNLDEIYKDDEFIYHFDTKTLVLKPFKYWDRIYDIERPGEFDFVRQNRKDFVKLHNYFERLESNLDIAEYLRNIDTINNQKIRERRKV